MRKIIVCWLAVILTLLGVASFVRAASFPPPVGGPLPDITLPAPSNSTDKNYLGLSGFGSFKITQIRAKVVIIEIFNMYCPYCQREAPNVNELYTKINQNPALKDAVKVIGIGAGNTPFEVGIFNKKYNVPFPLFADEKFVIHGLVGEVRTPYFIAVKINPDGTSRVIYSKLGALGGVDDFLSTLIRLSELQ
ncbi:MAG: peroxiredoxin family protein [Syntrophales bacterium]